MHLLTDTPINTNSDRYCSTYAFTAQTAFLLKKHDLPEMEGENIKCLFSNDKKKKNLRNNFSIY